MAAFTMTTTIEYQGRVPGTLNLTQRAFNEIVRSAWEGVGLWYRRERFPVKFTRQREE